GKALFIDGGDPFDYVSGYTRDGLPMTRSELERIVGKLGPTRFLMLADVYRIPKNAYLSGEWQSNQSAYHVGVIGLLLPQSKKNRPDRRGGAPVKPPNTTGVAPIQNLRGNVEKLLTYKNPIQKLSCAEAVQNLIDTAATIFPKWKGQNSKTFMEAFNRISDQHGFVNEIPKDMYWAGGTGDRV